ncbi:MAG: aspartate-semialdehyde dehydrogenase [Lentisphaerae bacterium RIFOXYB12_FULL_65_16]|nr:MAG: aspartate-semialdehyde dehydrogenase [Lentisphaerae bacterium RIFOXYA12_64_32]OGV93696.1 MAG: aspartate-semialdehyde dehydrogenase [Lentisphaerae bacterium RIFOXYB12_FULL_65_16]
MASGFNVAVVGATGAVGVEMVETLAKRNFPVRNLRLLASSRSVGKTMTFKGEALPITELGQDSFKGIDIALFSAGTARSKEFRAACVQAGAVMIDNSSAFRMDADVPLVVPEVNPEDVKLHKGVIANPNCCTAIMVVAVYPLHKVNPVRRLVVDTYQAASGAGAKAMAELEEQTAAVLKGSKDLKIEALPQRIAFNLFPQVDAFLDNGYTKEEMKFLNETRKIMHHPTLLVSATCVRVPVLRAHSEAVHLEFERPMTAAEARAVLAKAPGIQVVDEPANKRYPMPIDASGMYDCLVGRIRQDLSLPDGRGIALFVSGDQLLKGAALNAVQIAELL